MEDAEFEEGNNPRKMLGLNPVSGTKEFTDEAYIF